MLLRKSRRRRMSPCHLGQHWTILPSGVSWDLSTESERWYEPVCCPNTVSKSSRGTSSYAMAVVQKRCADKIPMKCRTPIWQWGSRDQERKSHARAQNITQRHCLACEPSPLFHPAAHIAYHETFNSAVIPG
jgi:hypothetical protein